MVSENEKDQLYNRLIALKQEINFHNFRYHVLDDPIISDYEYDRLVQNCSD
jgi:DNA ligase (NAD+)